MTSINSLNLGKTAKNLSKEKVLKKVTNFKKSLFTSFGNHANSFVL